MYETATQEMTEKGFRPIWAIKDYITRRDKSPIEVRFDSEENVKDLSTKSFEDENLHMILTYLGRRVIK